MTWVICQSFWKRRFLNMQQPDKALDNKLTIKRKRIMSYFIEAAEKLIRTEGLDGCLLYTSVYHTVASVQDNLETASK